MADAEGQKAQQKGDGPLFARVVRVYDGVAGVSLQTGMDAGLTGFDRAADSFLFADDHLVSPLAEAAPAEIMLIESLAHHADGAAPKILVSGNVFGLTAIAFALAFPQATVHVLPCLRGAAAELSNDMTKGLAEKYGLTIQLMDGLTEHYDIVWLAADVLGKNFDQTIEAVSKHISETGLMLVRAAIRNHAAGTLAQIAHRYGFEHKLLRRTSSGMGALWPSKAGPIWQDALKPYDDTRWHQVLGMIHDQRMTTHET
ncbi:MAG: hypothetical protein EBZ69_08485 [Alphaproteobacteria bacterium]|nr:hypothetical protein [Alphaproteobacteria bacterium]NDC56824.1 hypothetical protein [Alphaproteobacteria bacterium]NDG04666.1 hypothetical protein [Alphaproteobacteria bacterium]